MNIVYGGSFNPVTKAHKEIVNRLKEEFNPENIIIIPTANNYNRKELIPFKDRYNMLKIEFSDCIILDLETKNEKYLGTYDTLNKLKEKYSDLYFVMGADNLVTINTWINSEKLLNDYKFIVFGRKNINIFEFIKNNLSKYKDNFYIINMDIDISSTDFRLNKNKDIISKEVLEYINKNHLYEE